MFIANLAFNGSNEAKELLEQEGKHLARQTISAYNQLKNKDNVVIGIRGGFIMNAPYVKETFVKELHESKIQCEIQLEQIEPIIGAYYLGLEKITKR